jgi:hypothetical protein
MLSSPPTSDPEQRYKTPRFSHRQKPRHVKTVTEYQRRKAAIKDNKRKMEALAHRQRMLELEFEQVRQQLRRSPSYGPTESAPSDGHSVVELSSGESDIERGSVIEIASADSHNDNASVIEISARDLKSHGIGGAIEVEEDTSEIRELAAPRLDEPVQDIKNNRIPPDSGDEQTGGVGDHAAATLEDDSWELKKAHLHECLQHTTDPQDDTLALATAFAEGPEILDGDIEEALYFHFLAPSDTSESEGTTSSSRDGSPALEEPDYNSVHGQPQHVGVSQSEHFTTVDPSLLSQDAIRVRLNPGKKRKREEDADDQAADLELRAPKRQRLDTYLIPRDPALFTQNPNQSEATPSKKRTRNQDAEGQVTDPQPPTPKRPLLDDHRNGDTGDQAADPELSHPQRQVPPPRDPGADFVGILCGDGQFLEGFDRRNILEGEVQELPDGTTRIELVLDSRPGYLFSSLLRRKRGWRSQGDV